MTLADRLLVAFVGALAHRRAAELVDLAGGPAAGALQRAARSLAAEPREVRLDALVSALRDCGAWPDHAETDSAAEARSEGPAGTPRRCPLGERLRRELASAAG